MPKEALGSATVRLEPQSFRAAVVEPLSNQVSPAEADGHEGEEFIEPFKPVQMRRFYIEAGDLYRREK